MSDHRPTQADGIGDDAFEARPSKSQRKRDSLALQDLGVELVGLAAGQLARIELPAPLRAAVRDAQGISSNGAKRRQMQYIGRLMRAADAAPIRAALAAIQGVSAAAKAREQRLERLRQALLETEDGLADIARAFPAADLRQLRQLRRNALKEQAQGKPSRAFREIFRLLRELDAGGPDSNSPPGSATQLAPEHVEPDA